MADNVTLPGTGLDVATEELSGGVHAQVVIINKSISAKDPFTDFATETTLAKVVNRPSTATASNVSSSAINVTLLSSNGSRIGATIYNDSTANLYLKLGATASTTSFTLIMAPGAYYEVPFGYTGRIDGIWASANGAARITELTA